MAPEHAIAAPAAITPELKRASQGIGHRRTNVVAFSAAAAGLDRVGRGDSREGYESPDYVTESRRVDALGGESAQLAALVTAPPLGLPPLSLERPVTTAGIELGRRLFFDRRLSFNGTLSCAMCHIPEQGFTQNELATPVGIEGRSVKRNAPALYNVAYRKTLFFDGREESLEQQIWSPLLATNEMGNPTVGTVLRRLREIGEYDAAFQALYGEGIGMETLGRALADYQRALLSADSPFDRWYFGGDATALPDSAKRGFALFVEAGCSSCHQIQDDHALFTDDGFHNTGLGLHRAVHPSRRVQLAPGVFVERRDNTPTPRPSDLGRYEATGQPGDRWKFRTPSLRNVAVTAPYMHDGSLATLRDVIEFYDAGGVPGRVETAGNRKVASTPSGSRAPVRAEPTRIPTVTSTSSGFGTPAAPGQVIGQPVAEPRCPPQTTLGVESSFCPYARDIDTRIRPLGLTDGQKQDLVEFLQSLNGSNLDALAADARLTPIGD